ncbi:unnamed protein product, partial [Brassica napus]
LLFRVLFFWLNTMKKVEIFLICLCLKTALFLVSADPQTCPAESGAKCSGSGDWEGEFFHEIPHIKDLRAVTHLLTNAEEEILGSNPLAYKWIHLSEDDRSTFDRPNLLLPKEPVDSRKLQEETCRWNIVPSVHHSMYILPY